MIIYVVKSIYRYWIFTVLHIFMRKSRGKQSVPPSQVSERQASELSHASFLQLNINTSDGVETINIAFDTPDRSVVV